MLAEQVSQSLRAVADRRISDQRAVVGAVKVAVVTDVETPSVWVPTSPHAALRSYGRRQSWVP